MIYDSFKNLARYNSLINGLDLIAPFLLESRFDELAPGKTGIDENIFLLKNEYRTGSFPSKYNGILENHRKYLDVQCILGGQEVIEYERWENQTLFEAYNDQDDVEFFHADKPISLIASPGSFFIFFPGDIHMPGRIFNAESDIRKIVFKIRTD